MLVTNRYLEQARQERKPPGHQQDSRSLLCGDGRIPHPRFCIGLQYPRRVPRASAHGPGRLLRRLFRLSGPDDLAPRLDRAHQRVRIARHAVRADYQYVDANLADDRAGTGDR